MNKVRWSIYSDALKPVFKNGDDAQLLNTMTEKILCSCKPRPGASTRLGRVDLHRRMLGDEVLLDVIVIMFTFEG